MSKVDWPTLISDLQAGGMSQAQIATECLTGQSHISALMRGDRREPRFSLGQRLVALHASRVVEHATAPEKAAA